MSDDDVLAQDAEDRRAALTFAADLLLADPVRDRREWQQIADRAYCWLRRRDTLRVVAIDIVPGTPRPEGTKPMTTTISLDDTDEVPFTLTGLDAKDAATPLPDGFVATWTLADPDGSGAALTPSADGTTAVLAAGTPDTNVMVTVSVAIPQPDGSTTTLTGAEAVIVQATEATTIGIVAGTPTPEPAAGS